MTKIKVKVAVPKQALRSLSGKKIRVVPMVTVRGYIADIERMNKQIRALEKEIELERQKLYGKQKKTSDGKKALEPMTVKP